MAKKVSKSKRKLSKTPQIYTTVFHAYLRCSFWQPLNVQKFVTRQTFNSLFFSLPKFVEQETYMPPLCFVMQKPRL